VSPTAVTMLEIKLPATELRGKNWKRSNYWRTRNGGICASNVHLAVI